MRLDPNLAIPQAHDNAFSPQLLVKLDSPFRFACCEASKRPASSRLQRTCGSTTILWEMTIHEFDKTPVVLGDTLRAGAQHEIHRLRHRGEIEVVVRCPLCGIPPLGVPGGLGVDEVPLRNTLRGPP